MYCDECGELMQWRSTNQLTRVAKYKCLHCGNVQEGIDDYKPLVVELAKPKYYYFNKGRFIVHRMIDGVNRYIGSYGNEETAKKVVCKMEEYDWDKSMLPKVYEELNIRKENRVWVCV